MRKIIALSSGIVFFVLTTCAFGVDRNRENNVSKLSVQGNGKIEVPADLFKVSVGVLTTDKKLDQAMNMNSDKMKNVEEVFGSLGLSKDEYKTSGFSVNPVFSPRPKNVSSKWERKIISYEVSNTFEVKSTNIKLIGKLLQSAADAGANKIGDINFGLSNPNVYRGDAIKAAVNNANNDAMALANAAGLSLTKIIDISLNNFYVPNLRMSNASFALKDGSSFNSVPVNPGMIKLNVDVNIVYEVQPSAL